MSRSVKVLRAILIKHDNIIFRRLSGTRCYSQHSGFLPARFLNNLSHPHKRKLYSSLLYQSFPTSTTTNSLDYDSTDEDGLMSVSENQFASKLFAESIYYSKTTMKPFKTKMYVSDEEAQNLLNANWSDVTSSDLLCALRKLSYYSLNNDVEKSATDYDYILKTLEEKLSDFTKEELTDLVRYLVPLCKHLNDHQPFVDLYGKINYLFKLKINKLSNTELFVLCDIFRRLYAARLLQTCSFMWSAVLKLGSKPNKLSPKNLVQFCFLINLCRKTPVNMYNIEYRLRQCLDDITINELGIVAMGFFKTQTRIRDPELLKTIIDILRRNLDNVESVSLGSIFKLFRYSTNLSESSKFQCLLKELVPYIPKHNFMTLLHIGHACAKICVYNEDVLRIIVEKFQKNLKNARLKDMERIIYIMTTFSYDPSHPLYHQIIQELSSGDRTDELMLYNRMLPWLLQYLAYVNIYPLQLYQIVLNKDYINKLCKRDYYALTREYLVLHYGLKIDAPNYAGPFLEDKPRDKLIEKYELNGKIFKRKFGKLYIFFNDVVYRLREIIDSEVYIGQLLPHIQKEHIVIGLDKNNNYVSAIPMLSSFSNNEVKHVHNSELKDVRYIAIVFVNSYVKNKDYPLAGIANIEVRHLEMMGFLPALLYQDSWLAASPDDKQKLLKNILSR